MTSDRPSTLPVGRFLVLCTLDPRSYHRVDDLRESHLQHVGRHRAIIAYGGVIGVEGGPPDEILYLIDVESAQQATEFAEADPYADLYASVRIEPFSQRLPNPATPTRDR